MLVHATHNQVGSWKAKEEPRRHASAQRLQNAMGGLGLKGNVAGVMQIQGKDNAPSAGLRRPNAGINTWDQDRAAARAFIILHADDQHDSGHKEYRKPLPI